MSRKALIFVLAVVFSLLIGCSPTEIQSTEIQPSAATATARKILVDQECARYPERCVDWSATFAAEEAEFDDYPESNRLPNLSQDGCPTGCTYHPDGCDIKGNIAFDTKEKIYHIPGGEYYTDTIINPSYGERWFCTEAEAIANGWRKSYK